MTYHSFTITILRWFSENRRNLPWRETNDPYAIWLSEIILQQTRIQQGTAYWERFMERFPTVEALAAASEDEVLRLWQGLGYYSRARNLHKAANEDRGAGRQDRSCGSHRTRNARSRLCSPIEVHLTLRVHRCAEVRKTDVCVTI